MNGSEDNKQEFENLKESVISIDMTYGLLAKATLSPFANDTNPKPESDMKIFNEISKKVHDITPSTFSVGERF